MSDNLLADAVEQILATHCDPRRVRDIEKDPHGAASRALWSEIEQSGFADALTHEDLGGSGLGLREAAPIIFACGKHAVPVPLALTLPIRAAFAPLTRSTGSATISVSGAINAEGEVICPATPYGHLADWVFVAVSGVAWLAPTAQADRSHYGGHGSLSASLKWNQMPNTAVALDGVIDLNAWRATAAAITAAQMAGAMEQLLAMTIEYANVRVQFGKPIGKLQAIQQQLSIMAEQVYAAKTAARLGLSASGAMASPIHAAIAKARVSEAAVAVGAISHAVHGAIGVTEEYDLQLYTRRLSEWRGQFGGESYWSQELGRIVVADTMTPFEFVQSKCAF